MDLRAIFLAIFVFLLTVLPSKSTGVPATNAMSRLRRSESTEPKKMCSDLIPCKWGVYANSSKKRVQYHIDNKSCTCGEERKCEIAEENLSMAAYIYRCKNPPNPTTEFTIPDNPPTTTP